jgi:hypothetical protein
MMPSLRLLSEQQCEKKEPAKALRKKPFRIWPELNDRT